MGGKFHHFGVPTGTRQPDETYIAGGKVYVTDPERHPYRVEFVRFEEGSPMPEILQRQPHAAFVVESIERAMEGKRVILPPFQATQTIRAAFIADGDAVIELMEIK